MLVDWAQVNRQLIADLGRGTIERAQSYYDAQVVVEKIQQELASARASTVNLGEQLCLLQSHQERAEDSFHAYLEDPSEAGISEEEWRCMLPEKPECPEDFRGNGKLLRAWRMASLSDAVAGMRRQLDRASKELARVDDEYKAARELLAAETSKHAYCTRNCSVRRAQGFFERRRAHELALDTQAREMQALDGEIAEARQALEEACSVAKEARNSRAPSRKDLTPADYEMPEFYDCESDDDDGRGSTASGG